MNEAAETFRPGRARAAMVSAYLSSIAGFLSVVFPKLSIAAMLWMLLSALSLPPRKAARSGYAYVLLALAAPCLLLGLVRFTIAEAGPGMVLGGRQQLEKQALYRLRELRLAQDFAREQAPYDPDHDGIGSAGTLDELSGHIPFRGNTSRTQGFLRFPPTIEGALGRVALVQEYLIVLYLPTPDGTGTTAGPLIDEELSERRWVAYAWPRHNVSGEHKVFFIDEHERILVSDNDGPRQGYVGTDRMPRFDAALVEAQMTAEAAVDQRGQDGGKWVAWKGKRPRPGLPGDRSGPSSVP